MKPERISLLVALSLSLAPVSASPQGGGRSAPAACSLLSATDLAALTGRKELANAKPIGGTGDEPGATNCGYVGTSLQVEVQPLPSVDAFDAAAARRVKAGEFQPATGVGDAAWFRINKPASQYGVVVRVGATMLTLGMDMKEAGTADQAREVLMRIAAHAARGLPR